MRELWAADCETDPFDGHSTIEPFLWGAYNGSEYHEFTTTDAFVDFIAEHHCICYAHNGGKFDWHFLLDRLEPFSPVMVIAGRLARFSIGAAEFRDSYNILPAPLSAYKKDEIDYSKFTRANREHHMREIREYLRTDCLYLYQFVVAFVAEYGLNLTFASAAMKMWQKIEQVKAPSTDADFYRQLSPYYYGGRVEASKPGVHVGQFEVIDINSAYPFAMTHLHPYGSTFVDGCQLAATREEIARQFISLQCASKGAFPWRHPDLSLEFPNDGKERIFHVTGHEFLAAMDCGLLQRYTLLRTLTFAETIKFSKYIDHFYTLKTAAKLIRDNKALDPAIREQAARDYEYAKFFLNGLYGKFCANPEEYREYQIIPPIHIAAAEESDGWTFAAQLGPWAMVQRELPEDRQRYYNLATGASITGFVRAYLLRALRQCTGILYCDTDSITARTVGTLLESSDANRLGDWSHVMTATLAAIAGKKLYSLQSAEGHCKTASKGVKLTHDDIVRIAQGETIEYNSLAPSFSVHTYNQIERVHFRQTTQKYIKRRISRTSL